LPIMAIFLKAFFITCI